MKNVRKHITKILIASALGIGLIAQTQSIFAANQLGTSHKWNFDNSTQKVALDTLGKSNGILSNTTWNKGIFGSAISINGNNDSYVNLGKDVGNFGTKDFTVSFWVNTSESTRLFDLMGNRTASSHGNFLSIRMTGNHESVPTGTIIAEIDQDDSGNNYTSIQSKSGLNDGTWHQVAVVRKGTSLKLYIDGLLSSQSKSKNVINISNGNNFIIGRSLDKEISDKFAPNALFDEVYIDSNSLNSNAIRNLYLNEKQWKFNEASSNLSPETSGGESAILSNASISKGIVSINGSDNSFVNFGNEVGNFGTENFAVSLWFKTAEKERYFDIIGNRTDGSHGNFFSLRMTGVHESIAEGTLVAELDQDETGSNYLPIQSAISGLNDNKWHHVAVVRDGNYIKLYVDGRISASRASNSINKININNKNDFKLGRSLIGISDKFAPKASYDDVRVYRGTITNSDIQNIYDTRK